MHVVLKYTANVKEYYRWNGINLVNDHKHGTERNGLDGHFYNNILSEYGVVCTLNRSTHWMVWMHFRCKTR